MDQLARFDASGNCDVICCDAGRSKEVVRYWTVFKPALIHDFWGKIRGFDRQKLRMWSSTR